MKNRPLPEKLRAVRSVMTSRYPSDLCWEAGTQIEELERERENYKAQLDSIIVANHELRADLYDRNQRIEELEQQLSDPTLEQLIAWAEKHGMKIGAVPR